MSTLKIFLLGAFLSFLPISELRGAIPFLIYHNIPWYIAWPFASFVNALVAPFCWIFLSTLHKLFLKMKWYKKFFDKFVENARLKIKPGVEKWGALGIAIFVAIPLPITGAWTATLGAWVLNLEKRKTMLAVILGVIISGGIVSTAMTSGIELFNIFFKKV
ncbi:MAG: small multi-drug export protein [Termitinemataceae bacterium]|nr:MAG: small multi-drug export protein [Termitinemataceae bacterium]